MPLVAHPETAAGDLAGFGEGIAIGSGVARELGVGVGDVVTLVSPEGMDTPFGTQPRISDYEVAYVFGVGRFDIDRVRVYMPFEEAQAYFNREGAADEIEVMVEDPAAVERRRAGDRRGGGAAGAGLDLARRLGGVPRRARRRAAGDVHHPVARGADRGAQHHLRASSCW